jgi:transposase-like protein
MSSSIFHEPAFEKASRDSEPQSAQNCPDLPTENKSSQLDPSGLNEKQRAAVELLAMGRSYVVAAKELDIGRRTLFDWRQKEAFQLALRQRHRELWGDVTERLRMLADPSVEVLVEHLNDCYDRSRFRAATAILKLANIGREVRE